MLAYFAAVVLPFFFLSIGYWSLGNVLSLAGAWRWILAYPVGMALVGLVVYFLWLVGVTWPLLVILVAFFGVILSRDLFVAARRLSWPEMRSRGEVLLGELRTLSPLETLLFAAASGGFALTVAWHIFVQPVVWDSLVLYDFRALRIAEGWQLEHFYEQFSFDPRFSAYDFSHPFLSSIWQALSYSFYAPVSTTVYLGLLLSVLATAWKVLPTRRSWLAFSALLFTSSLFFTIWTQNYAVEPYALFWLLIALFVFTSKKKLPPYVSALTLLFLITSMSIRVSEPYWLVFLLWISWPVLRNNQTGAQKLLQLCFWWLPALAVFSQWWQLQETAQSWSQVEKTVSHYDPARYSDLWQVLTVPQLWLGWTETLLLKNQLLSFFLLAIFFLVFQDKESSKRRDLWLLLLFTGMLSVALLAEMAADWPDWQGKARLLQRAGIPIAAVAVVLTAQRIGWQSSQNSKSPSTRLDE